jgi:hypothetical protein
MRRLQHCMDGTSFVTFNSSWCTFVSAALLFAVIDAAAAVIAARWLTWASWALCAAGAARRT